MGFATIEIQPTVVTGAYTAADVVFDLTAINLPAKHCKLLSVFAYVGDQNGTASVTTVDGDSMILMFFKDNSGGNLGTAHATANITPANFVSNKFLGMCKLTDEADVIDAHVDNLRFMTGHRAENTLAVGNMNVGDLGIVLEGDMSTGVGNTCYVSAIDIGTLVFTATDDLRIVFHVEY
jgi:hypothetical protein